MKAYLNKTLLRAVAAAAALLPLVVPEAAAERLVILSTNDTHSQIDPDFDGRGGALRRKAIIDSVRAAEEHVLLVDAGDAVQGTLYFTLFGGEVELAMLDSLGYDVYTLGNHEFDNGMEPLRPFYSRMRAARVSANYGLDNTPLAGLFEPYVIKEYAGRRVAVMGVNLLPDGMIAPANCSGVEYTNSSDAANALAGELKRSGQADFVIALTHVGYSGGTPDNPSDTQIVARSRDIDLVIGGHSHTTLDPADPASEPWMIANADGREIPVTQTGYAGKKVGYIAVNLDDMQVEEYRLITVDKRYDDRASYPGLEAYLAPYKARVDSLMRHPVARSAAMLDRGTPELENFTADAAYAIAAKLYDGEIDMAFMNSGGIRQPIPEGDVSEGVVRSTYPFENRLVVLEITGERLIEALKIMASRGGDPVSSQVRVEFERGEPGGQATLLSATIGGAEIDPAATYHVATIDYLANGGDYMTPLPGCPRTYEDIIKIGDRIIEYLQEITAAGEIIDPSREPRMIDVGKPQPR